MSDPETRTQHPAVLAAAQELSSPLRALIEARGAALADELEVPAAVATAALAGVMGSTTTPELFKEIGRDEVAGSGMGRSSAFQAIADLSGISRQGVSKLLAVPKK